jgi:hypothetical protein
MIFTFLISIVFIAEIIITVALIKALLNFDKKVCELNETIILIKPQVSEVSELARLVSGQLVELSKKFVDDFKRNNENMILCNFSKALLGLFLIKTNIGIVRKLRKSRVMKTLAKGLSLLGNMV